MSIVSGNSPITLINKLTELNALEDVFYITGSRYFGTHRVDSDWDFLTSSDNPGNHERLTKLGFKLNHWDNNYNSEDESISTVYTWEEVDCRIDVQIVHSVYLDWKLRTQAELFGHMTLLHTLYSDLIANSPSKMYHDALYKELKKSLWSLAFKQHVSGNKL